ncbi:MAG: hypothetical protein ACI9LT_001365, partial [Pseudoalteromonas distincta]
MMIIGGSITALQPPNAREGVVVPRARLEGAGAREIRPRPSPCGGD